MWRDLTQLGWKRRDDIRAFATVNLDHDDDRGLLAALVLLGLDYADASDHERLVAMTSAFAMFRNRPDFHDPGAKHDHCPVCRCAVRVHFTNSDECPDDT